MLRAEVPAYVSEYVDYVCSLLDEIAPKDRLVVVGPVPVGLTQRVFRVGINFEHTLVRSTGRDLGDAPLGLIPVPGVPGERYRVRLVNQDYLSACDLVIDYSMPNVFNVRCSRRFPHIAERHVYIAPCLYPIRWERTDRTIDVLTTFLDPDQPRRKTLLANSNGLITNVATCFANEDICRVYQSAKILINIHQTPDHHTFEELRVLPALENGVIVLAEESPLKELVPYHPLVIWVSYDRILEVARDILTRYAEVWSQVFTPNHRAILESLHAQNRASLSAATSRS